MSASQWQARGLAIGGVTGALVLSLFLGLSTADLTSVRGALDATRTTSPLTASGWTTSAVGVGTGALDGGVFTASAANGAGGGGNAGGETTRAFPVSSSRWTLVCRVAKTGTSASEWIVIVTVNTGATYTYALARADGNIHYNTGSGLSGGTSFPVNGTGWMSIRYDGARVVYRYGTGTTTTPPTSWTLLYDAIVMTGRAVPPTAITLTGRTNAGLTLGADSTWVVDHLTVTDDSPGGS